MTHTHLFRETAPGVLTCVLCGLSREVPEPPIKAGQMWVVNAENPNGVAMSLAEFLAKTTKREKP